MEGLPEGVMFENGTIQGTPKVTWNGSEESRAITVTVKAEKDGATGRETFVGLQFKRYGRETEEPISRYRR